MTIEDQDAEIQEDRRCCCCCFCCSCCRRETQNPDLNQANRTFGKWSGKLANFETGYLIPHHKRPWNGKSLEEHRMDSMATRMLPGPILAIQKNNRKGTDKPDTPSTASFDMNITDVNNLLRRRLSLRVLVNEENESGEIGEAILPQQKSNFSEAAPILLSHLVRNSPSNSQVTRKRSSVKNDFMDRVRASISMARMSRPSLGDLLSTPIDEEVSLEQKSDKDFIDYLVKTSNFMKEALEKDWSKTKSYIKWLEGHIKSPKFLNKAKKSTEKWMVVLYTSSEDSRDQLSNFRCMLVRFLLQHHCVLYEERDIMLPQFQQEFQDRLAGDPVNIPQVYMQGLNIGGYRVMFGIHRLGLTKQIFKKFTKPPEAYAEWMFNRDNKSNQLSLDVNLKAFPALQALAGSWSNDKLSPHHLEFVTMGKFVVKHGRERWYTLSSQPYTEPNLRRYALLRLTIIHALCAMNKIYKLYLNKIEPEGASKLRRKLSWLPRFSKQMPKD